MRTKTANGRHNTTQDSTQSSLVGHGTVIESLFDLEVSTAGDFEELGFPFTALDEFTEEEAQAFEAIEREDALRRVKDR